MDIPQEHLRGDHTHVRLWTRLYGMRSIIFGFEDRRNHALNCVITLIY